MKKIILGFAALFLLAPVLSQAVEEADLLEPEKAFVFSAKALDGSTLEVRYQIAKDYYLYRDKFKFEVEPKDATLGAAQIPPGKVKQDEFFGKVETHRGQLVIKLPINRGSAQAITLKATSQGCADVGVCYPPLTQSVKINFSDPAPAARGGGALAALKDLGLSLGGSGDELLPAEEAFKVSLNTKDANTLLLTIAPSANVYLYRDKIKVTLLNGKGVTVAGVKLPRGEEKTDPSFGKTEVYHHPVTAEVSLKRDAGSSEKIALRVDYQGCNEKVGVCYPPLNQRFDVSLLGGTVVKADSAPAATAPISDQAAPAPLAAAPAAAQDEQSQIASILKGGDFWLIIASFFGFGLLLTFTPCVFPMIPILSGIIAGQGHQLTKTKSFTLSLTYVLGMAITYTAAGVAAGKSGALLSAALQNPWVLGSFAVVFVVLSFSMFGFFELQMPSFIQSRLTESSNKIKGGNLGGVFIMGALSALIVGPCVAAPLAGALLYISQTGDAWLGGWSLFALSLGMGAPLIGVGVAGGALLPRAGGWMNAVKAFFGVLLLGVAIWLISPVISSLLHMLLWAALLIISAIYLHALDPLPPNASGFKKFWKGWGVISLVVGASLAIGALSGSRDILQPLAGMRLSTTGSGAAIAAPIEHGLNFERVKSVAELEARIQAAKGKPVMLDFYADWCVSCKEMERFTFNDPKVQARLKDVLLLQADVTANSDADRALLKRFKLFGPPGIIFFNKEGVEQTARVIGYQAPEKFLQSLDSALK
ncbi:MAG: protein-disulfide reductase DsbD [Hydrogenophilales bacterium]|nr:protein-disulfide reductase DsbD [Hydrogenophilales bacterium]